MLYLEVESVTYFIHISPLSVGGFFGPLQRGQRLFTVKYITCAAGLLGIMVWTVFVDSRPACRVLP